MRVMGGAQAKQHKNIFVNGRNGCFIVGVRGTFPTQLADVIHQPADRMAESLSHGQMIADWAALIDSSVAKC